MKSLQFSILFVLFCLVQQSYAQRSIQFTGTLTDELGTTVSGANVVVRKIGSPAILAFSITKNDGIYRIQTTVDVDSLILAITHISYKKVERKIATVSQQIDIVLESEVQMLDAIVIKKPNAIERRGDTLIFNLDEFKSQKDRVIADVLKKIPGIEIEANGRILYQGKPIQKYYIEGLDLLEGKYKLANENIPADAVESVEVLENHQPIRALDSLVSSEETSLNIKLKNKITTTGTAKLGSGYRPLLWEANLTPMFFKKKQQAIASLQSNNIGDDIGSQLEALTMDEILDMIDNPFQRPIEWLTIQRLAMPPFSKDRWLDNESHLISVNHLSKLSNDLEIKSQVAYLHDYQRQVGSNRNTIFAPNEPINFIENTRNRLLSKKFEAKFILTKNTQANFFKNTLEIKRQTDTHRGFLTGTNGSLTQEMQSPVMHLQNRFKWILPIKKNAFTFESFTEYRQNNPYLDLDSIFFKEVLAVDTLFDGLRQEVRFEDFITRNTVSFLKKIKSISLTSKIGFQTQLQQFGSQLRAQALNNERPPQALGNAFTNNLNFSQHKAFWIIKALYEKNKWRFDLNMPVSYNYFDYRQQATSERLAVFILEPRLYISKEWNAFWKSGVTLNKRNSFGEINSLYANFLLPNYRRLQQNDAPLRQNVSYSTSISTSYRNPLKSLFFSMFFVAAQQESNLLYANVFLENGTSLIQAQERANTNYSYNINTNLSKYISKLRTTFSVNPSYSIAESQFLNNQILGRLENHNLRLSTKLNIDVAEWFSIIYENTYAQSRNTFESDEFNRFEQWQHHAELFVYPTDRQYIALKTDVFTTNFEDNRIARSFLDINYQYTLKQHKIDFNISARNIFNTQNFVNTISDVVFFNENSFVLRPRQVLCTVKFQL